MSHEHDSKPGRTILAGVGLAVVLLGMGWKAANWLWLKPAEDRAALRRAQAAVADREAARERALFGGENPMRANRDQWKGDRAEHRPVIESFLAKLREGDTAGAYAMTGSGLRTRTSANEFVAAVRDNQIVGRLARVAESWTEVIDSVTSYSYIVAVDGEAAGTTRFKVSLENESGRWVINAFELLR